MLKIEEGVIYLTRGDDAVIDVQVTNIAGEDYTMQTGDTLTMTVRDVPDSGSPVILAVTSAKGEARIIIDGDETAEINPGQYSADIQLNTQDGKRYTIWPELEGASRYKVSNFKNFVIMPDVTDA